MPQTLTLSVSQSRTRSTPSSTLSALSSTAHLASRRGAHLLLFPEAYLGGYPRTCGFGAVVGSRSDEGREQFLNYWKSAVDLGDTPSGLGDDWVGRSWLGRRQEGEGAKKEKGTRGDGTREFLENVARETGVFLVVGLVEKAGGSLYCGCVYVCPREGCIGKRRKIMPTGSERLVWAQGSPSTLKAVTTTIAGVKLTLAAAICWENYMPLLRHSLYSQNINLYLAPTADARDTWLPLMRTIALEGRAFVLSANQCMRENHLPHWIRGKQEEEDERNTHQELKANAVNSSEIQKNHESVPPNDSTPSSTSGEPRLKETATSAPNSEINDHLAALSDAISVSQKPTPRRPSIVTRTSDNHELHLPATSSSGLPSTSSQPHAEPSTSTSPFVSRGGSSIVSPTGAVLAGPLWEVEEGRDGEESLLFATVDFEDCVRGRLDFDAAGSYSRNDSFRLVVEGLSLDPPE